MAASRHLRTIGAVLVAAISGAASPLPVDAHASGISHGRAERRVEPSSVDGHRVRLLEHASGRPVPDAIVAVVDLAQLDGLTRAQLLASNGTDLVDEEPVLEHAARLYRADGEGRLRIPRSDGPHCLVARAGEHAGVRRITPLDAGPTTIVELVPRPRREARVAVVDASGSALAGVPVAIVETGGSPVAEADRAGTHATPRTRERARARTGATGRVALALGASSQAIDSAASGRLTTWATFAFPHAPRVAVALDFDSPDTAAVDLVAPATGSLDVEVIGPDGKLSREASSVLLVASVAGTVPSASGDVIDERRIELVGGRARLDHVGLGLRFHAFARWQGRDARSPEIAGPTRAGGSTTLRIELARVLPVATVRVVDPDGAPYAARTLDARVQIAMMRPKVLASHPVETDAEGRCFVALGDAALAKEQRRVFALVARDARIQADFDLTQPMPVGVHDLGVAELRAPWARAVPLLVGGRVVGEDGTPIEGAEVALLRTRNARSESPPSLTEEAPPIVTGADGAFDFRGWYEPGELALRVTKRGYMSVEAAPFERNSSDVAVALARSASLEGELLLDPGSPPEPLSIALRRDGVPAAATTRHTVLRDGSFWIGEAARGRVDVLVLLAGSDVPVAVVDALELRAGETARVPAIDLRDALRVLDFRVVDPDGGPVERVDVDVSERDADAKPETRASSTFSKGHVRLLVPEAPIVVTLRADGFRTLVLHDVETIKTAVLERFLPVRLRLSVPPTAVPERARLAPIVRSDAGDALVLTAQSHFHGFDERGEILLEVSRPGRYSVTYEVLPRKARADTLPVNVTPDPPHSIEVIESDEEQVFVLDLSEKRIEEALAKAR